MAANTDKFKKGARKLSGNLDASGITDAVVDNFGLITASGIPTGTGVDITIDRVDTNGVKTPNKEEVITGVVSGDRIISCVRGVEGTAQAHSAGAVWEIRLTAKQWNDIVDGILVEHEQNGMHKTLRTDISSPRGFLINGKISVVDAAGITVSIKTLLGADPSITDPVYIRIGDTVRAITSALSRSLADGTNWFNAGSAELATREIDYFAYLVWDSNSSAVGLTFARIPYANLVSEFSATTTNEKHCAGYSNFTTTDEVENIGRFAATLSVGTGYTWTVPTYNAINLVQRPIFETRRLMYIPQIVGFASATVQLGYYKVLGSNLFLEFVDITGISNSTGLTFTIPFTSLGASRWISGRGTDNGVVITSPAMAQTTTASITMTAYSTWQGGGWTASGSKIFQIAQVTMALI